MSDERTTWHGVRTFLEAPRVPPIQELLAVSLFSGAGLSDAGYEQAGFRFVVQADLHEDRATIGQRNFPSSTWVVGDLRQTGEQVVRAYTRVTDNRPALLVATPPCQGMSSSNPGRGKRTTEEAKAHEEKNSLILAVSPIARKLVPRVLVVENVRPVLTLRVRRDNREGRVIDLLREDLSEYELFEGVVNVADYGVPQVRRRAIVVGVHRDEPWLSTLVERNLLPWPRPTHAEQPTKGQFAWVSVREWLEGMGYEPLDAKDERSARGQHPLHFVRHYDDDRYLQVSQIPPFSGRSAYQNETCPDCGVHPVPEGTAVCTACGAVMRNRPYVVEDSVARLIKGFLSSYRRMDPNQPASTVTTNSSHIGSDFKLHPWENRVLSILECADVQAVPRWYDWSPALEAKRSYLIRNVVGEAFPPYFTYLHGQILRGLLTGSSGRFGALAHRSKIWRGRDSQSNGP